MMIAISMVLLFVGIGLLILIHVCIVGRAYRRGIGNTNIVDRGSSLRSNSMSHEDIEKLPSFAFRTKDKGTSSVECAICLANLKLGEKCRLLPFCNHSFHAECIDLWLLKTSICPICRATADFTKGESISGGESSRFSESGRREWNADIVDLAENGNSINSSSFDTRGNSTSSRFDESGSSRFDESGRQELHVEIVDAYLAENVDAYLAENVDSSNSLSFEMRENIRSRRLDASGDSRFNESERHELNEDSTNSEHLSGIVSTNGQNTEGIVNTSGSINLSENSKNTTTIESIHHEELLQSRENQTE